MSLCQHRNVKHSSFILYNFIMPSPFPGMDPYLESPHIWEDFHTSLAAEIRNTLMPKLRPNYIAAIEPQVQYDEVLIHDIPITRHKIHPDVGIFKPRQPQDNITPTMVKAVREPILMPIPAPYRAKIAINEPAKRLSIEIRETLTGELITAIEILSPVNKRPSHEAFAAYQRKLQHLLMSQANVIEIDLLRAGIRSELLDPVPEFGYRIILSRNVQRPDTDVWAFGIRDPLPTIAVPLRPPHPDIDLDLGEVVRRVYDLAGYDMRVDYEDSPPKPALSDADMRWLQSHLSAAGVR